MKRTPVRGVKENLKPYVYKQRKGNVLNKPDHIPFAWVGESIF